MRIVDVRSGVDSAQIEKLVRAEETQRSVDSTVAEIVADVRRRGDAALCDYSQRFDSFPLTPDAIRLTAEELGLHASAAPPEMVEVLRTAIRNGREFHLQQKDECWEFYAGECELPPLQAALRAWEDASHHDRPHQALGYLTLAKYLAPLGITHL